MLESTSFALCVRASGVRQVLWDMVGDWGPQRALEALPSTLTDPQGQCRLGGGGWCLISPSPRGARGESFGVTLCKWWERKSR